MKKFLYPFTALLAAFVLLTCACALAEAPALPVNAPPAPGEYATRWQLYTGEPVEYLIDLTVDEETGLRTYTLQNPAEWGIDASVNGQWSYQRQADADQQEAEADQPMAAPVSGWVQTRQGGDTVTLTLTDSDYAELGFPAWRVPCADDQVQLSLNIYLGQVRQVYAYVDYLFGDSSISITAEDHSFIINLTAPAEDGFLTSYASYDPSGILAYAAYTEEYADGSLTGYRLEAIPAKESYQLTTITHADAQGNTCYWENGVWQNADFEKVDAPEGITPDQPPYTVTGDWQGIPFAQPGDAPEGVFPVGDHPVDALLKAAEYRPWPAGGEALYRNWAEGKAIPALPAAAWETPEDGTVVYTLTGLENWGVQPAHQCDWRWSEAELAWQPEGEPTPGRMRLFTGSEVTDVRWSQPCTDEDLTVTFCLNRANMTQQAALESLSGGWWWQLDQQGGLLYTRALDECRDVTVEYSGYTLLQYEVLTTDPDGAPVSQTVYDAPETSPDTYTLHLYYHYCEDVTKEALWLRDIGWYSYETGKPCDAPEGVQPESCKPFDIV